MSRRKVRRRRSDLQEIRPAAGVSNDVSNGFTFFDDPTSSFDRGPDKADHEAEDGQAASTEDREEPNSDSPSRRFGRRSGRRKSDPEEFEISAEGQALLDEAMGQSPETASNTPVTSEHDEIESAPPSILPTEPESPCAPEIQASPPPSATELLDRLREAERTKAPTSDSDGPSASTVLVATPETAPTEAVPNEDAIAEVTTSDPFGQPTEPGPSILPVSSSSMVPDPVMKGLDLETSPFSDPFVNQVQTEHTSVSEAIPTPSAPQSRSLPIPQAVAVANADGPTPPAVTPAALQPLGARQAPTADTDANGDWIPPILRGMAPIAERKDAPLPQRRTSD